MVIALDFSTWPGWSPASERGWVNCGPAVAAVRPADRPPGPVAAWATATGAITPKERMVAAAAASDPRCITAPQGHSGQMNLYICPTKVRGAYSFLVACVNGHARRPAGSGAQPGAAGSAAARGGRTARPGWREGGHPPCRRRPGRGPAGRDHLLLRVDPAPDRGSAAAARERAGERARRSG